MDSNMKFEITPTSEFRSIPNVKKFHFEGDTNKKDDVKFAQFLLDWALRDKVTLVVGVIEE